MAGPPTAETAKYLESGREACRGIVLTSADLLAEPSLASGFDGLSLLAGALKPGKRLLVLANGPELSAILDGYGLIVTSHRLETFDGSVGLYREYYDISVGEAR